MRELETSMILALDERLVLMDRAAPGFIGDLAPLRDQLMRRGQGNRADRGSRRSAGRHARARRRVSRRADGERDPLLPEELDRRKSGENKGRPG